MLVKRRGCSVRFTSVRGGGFLCHTQHLVIRVAVPSCQLGLCAPEPKLALPCEASGIIPVVHSAIEQDAADRDGTFERRLG